jgi:hypothetical protein
MPLGFFLSDWRDELWGAARMGTRHGLYCLGCGWAQRVYLRFFDWAWSNDRCRPSRRFAGSDSEAYFTPQSRRNVGCRADSGPFRGDCCRRAFRPTATFPSAIRYVRFTSIVWKNPQNDRSRKSRFHSPNLIPHGNRHDKAHRRATRGKIARAAEPLPNFPSRSSVAV